MTSPRLFRCAARNISYYLSAVHSRCWDMPVHRLLLENLLEEEQGEENHP